MIITYYYYVVVVVYRCLPLFAFSESISPWMPLTSWNMSQAPSGSAATPHPGPAGPRAPQGPGPPWPTGAAARAGQASRWWTQRWHLRTNIEATGNHKKMDKNRLRMIKALFEANFWNPCFFFMGTVNLLLACISFKWNSPPVNVGTPNSASYGPGVWLLQRSMALAQEHFRESFLCPVAKCNMKPKHLEDIRRMWTWTI